MGQQALPVGLKRLPTELIKVLYFQYFESYGHLKDLASVSEQGTWSNNANLSLAPY